MQASGQSGHPPESRILVVEDDADLRSILVELLEQEGHLVQQAAHGLDALACLLCSCEPTSLIVLDLDLSEPGAACFLDWKSRDLRLASIPVLLLSAATPDRQLAEPGVSGFLAKPLDLTALIATVDELLVRPEEEVGAGWLGPIGRRAEARRNGSSPRPGELSS